MTNPTLERAARAAARYRADPKGVMSDDQVAPYVEQVWANKYIRADLFRDARAVLMAVLPTLERYDSDYAGQYKDERGDYVLYADLEAILNDGEGE